MVIWYQGVVCIQVILKHPRYKLDTHWHLPRCAILSEAQKYMQKMRVYPLRLHAQKHWHNLLPRHFAL